MGAGQAAEITKTLLAEGVRPDTPVLVAESATLPQARRITLTLRELPGIAHSGITGPTLILLGRVVAAAASARISDGLPQRDVA
jgi:siroheme synthase